MESIRPVSIRVACAIFAILLFSMVTTINILRIEHTQAKSVQAHATLDQVQQAETAHYKWSANLSNALYTGSEFTGSMDHTACVLGKWLYGEMALEDEALPVCAPSWSLSIKSSTPLRALPWR